MKKLEIPPFVSGGLILSYQCSNFCRHCIYASSPRWKNWMTPQDLDLILEQVKNTTPNQQGLHLAGGEPFLNFDLTLQAVELCVERGVPLQYVETNASWCDNNEKTVRLLRIIRESGLPAILISASPFHNEYIPFEYTERAVSIAQKIFGPYNVIVYTTYFYQQLSKFDKSRRLSFNRYINTIGKEKAAQQFIDYYHLIPTGRALTRLKYLYQGKPASTFFNNNCLKEFTNPHHIHIDLYGNYIASFCSGISLGDARDLGKLYDGINLQEHPILEILAEKGVEGLLKLAKDQFNYQEREEGYIAKCHLCQDIRRHLVAITDQFEELTPLDFYLNL